MMRHQPPARSPIGAAAIARAFLELPPGGRDARAQLRARLLERFPADGVALYGSGTQALDVAFRIARSLDPEAPVLLPGYTCYEVATAAVGANVRVSLYDLDPDTLEPDAASIRAAAQNGAAAIVVSPLYGMPLDWARARAHADEIGTLLIEDAAQANGSTWRGRPVGCVGDLTVLSFGRGKGWTGQGGGALLWRGKASRAAEMVTSAVERAEPGLPAETKTAAMAVAQWLLGRPALYAVPASIPQLHLGETNYHAPRPPAAMRRVSAALVLANEAAAMAEPAIRRANAREYARLLDAGGSAAIRPIGARIDDDAGALRFPIRVAGGWDAVRHTDAPRLGAAPGYPDVLDSLPALRPLLNRADPPIPGSRLIARELVTLPTHSGTRPEERQRLARLVSELSAAG